MNLDELDRTAVAVSCRLVHVGVSSLHTDQSFLVEKGHRTGLSDRGRHRGRHRDLEQDNGRDPEMCYYSIGRFS